MSTDAIVDILLPFYNSQNFIERCVRSILNQRINQSMINIVFIDDGSTDKSREYISKYLRRIKNYQCITNNQNLGLPASLNLGIEASKAKYLIRIDSDDYVNEELINCLLEEVTNSEFDAIACDYFTVNDDETKLKELNCLENPIGCGIIFERKHVIEVGMYDSNFRYQEDAEFRVRFLKKYTIGRLDKPLYRYRKHGSNLTNNLREMNRFKEKLEIKHSE